MTEAFDLTETIVPKSDQLNAEDLLSGPRTVTVEKVSKGSAEQPVNIHLVEFPGRPFRPSKTVRRILVKAWGASTANYPGRRMTIYRDPAVRFGGLDVGGIRVSHVSDIKERLTLALTVTRGQRKPYVVEPLPAGVPVITDAQADEIAAAIQQAGDRAALTEVWAQIKTFDLAAHKDRLVRQWKERANALSESSAKPEGSQVEDSAKASPEVAPILNEQWSHASQMLDEVGYVDYDSKIGYLREFFARPYLADPLSLTEAEGNQLTDELTRQIAAGTENGDDQQ